MWIQMCLFASTSLKSTTFIVQDPIQCTCNRHAMPGSDSRPVFCSRVPILNLPWWVLSLVITDMGELALRSWRTSRATIQNTAQDSTHWRSITFTTRCDAFPWWKFLFLPLYAGHAVMNVRNIDQQFFWAVIINQLFFFKNARRFCAVPWHTGFIWVHDQLMHIYPYMHTCILVMQLLSSWTYVHMYVLVCMLACIWCLNRNVT